MVMVWKNKQSSFSDNGKEWELEKTFHTNEDTHNNSLQSPLRFLSYQFQLIKLSYICNRLNLGYNDLSDNQ